MAKAKKLLALALAATMVAASFSACQSTTDDSSSSSTDDSSSTSSDDTSSSSSDDDSTESEDEWVFGEDPLEISFYVNYDWYSTVGYGSTQATQWMQEELNVTVTEISSNGDAATKYATMVASDTLPDVVQMDRGSDFTTLAQNGSLVAIDDYMADTETYPYYSTTVDMDAVAMGATVDGSVYGMLNWYTSEDGINTSNKGWLLNTTIYEELGSPSLETIDEMYAYLQLVSETYDDVVPLDTANTSAGVVQVQNMIYAGMGEGRAIEFGKTDGLFSFVDFDAGVITSIFDDEAFKASYEWTNTFFQEKLLTQDTFTQTIDQFTEKLNTGSIAVAAIHDAPSRGETANEVLGYDCYTYIDFPVAEGVDLDGVVTEYKGTIGWNINVITSNCEYPERVYAFLDYCNSTDFGILSTYGPEGELWDELDENGAPIMNETYNLLSSEELSSYSLGAFKPQGSWTYNVLTAAVAAQDPDSVTINSLMSNYLGSNYVEVIGDELAGINSYPADSDESIIWTNIKLKSEEYVALLLFADSEEEFEEIFEEWEAAVESLGYQQLLDYQNVAWNANLELIYG